MARAASIRRRSIWAEDADEDEHHVGQEDLHHGDHGTGLGVGELEVRRDEPEIAKRSREGSAAAEDDEPAEGAHHDAGHQRKDEGEEKQRLDARRGGVDDQGERVAEKEREGGDERAEPQGPKPTRRW